MKILKFGGKSLAKKHAGTEQELLENLEAVLFQEFPNGKISGNDFVMGDVNGNSGSSLKVCLVGGKRGCWKDFATDEGGTAIALFAANFKLNIKTDLALVLSKIETILEKIGKQSAMPLPVQPKVNHALKKVAEWDYLYADGKYCWTIIRFEDAIGCKSIRPYNRYTQEYGAHPCPRPLYNLPGIAKSEVVIIVEGEKCAQALIEEGYCATTAMGGANTQSGKTNWSPLKGKVILVWPDNDEPGKKYALNCAVAALSAGAKSCDILSIPEGLSEGWDVADALMESSAFDVDAFIKDGERLPISIPNAFDLTEAFKSVEYLTEHNIAVVLAEQHAIDWKYCPIWGRWYFWDGWRWVHDQVLAFNYLARQVCHAASMFAKSPSFRAKIASASTSSNIERLARADPAHATSVEKWDTDPLLLNTTGGIVDLRTGKLSAHDRLRFLTKTATATPQGTCQQWLAFLKAITNDNQEFIAYLQRVLGYCLTGLTTEHALFFLYGTGANGKSVFLNVVSTIMGDYAKTAPMDTFMEARADRHPTDLAGLCGVRFVCASETEQGRRWSESKIKSITGGDKISARFMRQDFFEFTPQFKLLIAGNHKPAISNVDEAMSRRIHLVPFTVFIPPEKRDKHLTTKLLKERDGILAWMVEGLMKWRELDGLHPPEIVTKATRDYLEAEDAIGRWLDDCCVKNSAAFSSSNGLFRSWKHWAEDCGEYVGSQRKLSEQLMARGFERAVEGQARGFRGVQIKAVFGPSGAMDSGHKIDGHALESQM